MLLQSLAYYYDAVGNIVQTVDSATQSVYFNATVPSADQDFTYDAVYRLVAAEGREHAAVDGVSEDQDLQHDGYNIVNSESPTGLRRYTQAWVYDLIGNILSMTHSPDSPGTSWTRDYSYVTDTNLLEETDAGTVLTYSHDEHGNMIDMPHLAALDYDFADQLRHVEIASDQHVYFVCDASGERVRKVWITNSGNLRRERIYLGGYEVWRRYNKVGGDWVLDDERETLHVADDARRVCMIETLTWEDEDEITSPTPRFRFQLDNHLGTACVEVDESGVVITYEEYHPYGTSAYRAFKTGVEVSAKRYRYTGKERDEETSLYYHGARYYAPWLGRWTQADPAGLVDGPGLYNYCRGSPVVMSDPSGMQGAQDEQLKVSVPNLGRIAVKEPDLSRITVKEPKAITLPEVTHEYSKSDVRAEQIRALAERGIYVTSYEDPARTQRALQMGRQRAASLDANRSGYERPRGVSAVVHVRSPQGEQSTDLQTARVLLAMGEPGPEVHLELEVSVPKELESQVPEGVRVQAYGSQPEQLDQPRALQIASTQSALNEAAARAASTVGLGVPRVRGEYGSRVHAAFEYEVKALRALGFDVHAEVSYLRGREVRRGTEGSSRPDVVEGLREAPHTSYDLKTGSAGHTNRAIQRLRANLPNGARIQQRVVRTK